MADVLEIAKRRRAGLTAEIARLDDFIEMAEILLRSDAEHPERSDKTEANKNEAKPKGPGGDAPPVERSDAAGAFGSGATSEPQSDQAALRDARDSGDGARDWASGEDHISPPAPAHAPLLGTGSAPEEDELVLTEKLSDGSEEDVEIEPAVGQRIRHRRWNLGMTRGQLADQLGVPARALQAYEEGEGRASASLLARLAGALGVSTSYFFEETGSATADSVEAASGHVDATAERDSEALALARTA